MFTGLRLTNFKAWQDTDELKLKPVTMLLGTNSSGKSTLIQSLLLLKQTVQSPDRSIQLNLGGDEINDLFNFGDFDNVLRQDVSGTRQFSLSFSFDSSVASRVENGHFFCSYGKNSAGGVAIQEWRVNTGKHYFKSVRREKGAYSVFIDDENLPRDKGRHLCPERSVSLSAEALAVLGQEGTVLEDLSLSIRRELENIVYLGPLRRKPERDYVWNKSNPGEVGSDGHRAIDVLLASALMRGEEQNRIIEGVSKWLVRMKVADKLEVKQLGRSTRYELVVHRDGVEANLRDVGIGISQVLPVLTIAYFAPSGSTIILEEPEIHLHPLAQAVLAELFVEISKERKVQFIVETHSEHLFRRMQTLIARQELNLEDAAMYFVERERQHACLRLLEIDDFGRLTNWPDGFFGDALGETREQARLMFTRQQGGPA
ncbi:AAA family ATPase [Shewanella algae]|uniref:AAA family ATPase n=1 Tax=Shewanella algae TaxID=38313 RepID=UPI0031F4E839